MNLPNSKNYERIFGHLPTFERGTKRLRYKNWEYVHNKDIKATKKGLGRFKIRASLEGTLLRKEYWCSAYKKGIGEPKRKYKCKMFIVAVYAYYDKEMNGMKIIANDDDDNDDGPSPYFYRRIRLRDTGEDVNGHNHRDIFVSEPKVKKNVTPKTPSIRQRHLQKPQSQPIPPPPHVNIPKLYFEIDRVEPGRIGRARMIRPTSSVLYVKYEGDLYLDPILRFNITLRDQDNRICVPAFPNLPFDILRNQGLIEINFFVPSESQQYMEGNISIQVEFLTSSTRKFCFSSDDMFYIEPQQAQQQMRSIAIPEEEEENIVGKKRSRSSIYKVRKLDQSGPSRILLLQPNSGDMHGGDYVWIFCSLNREEYFSLFKLPRERTRNAVYVYFDDMISPASVRVDSIEEDERDPMLEFIRKNSAETYKEVKGRANCVLGVLTPDYGKEGAADVIVQIFDRIQMKSSENHDRRFLFMDHKKQEEEMISMMDGLDVCDNKSMMDGLDECDNNIREFETNIPHPHQQQQQQQENDDDDDVLQFDIFGASPLSYAVGQNRLDVIKRLVGQKQLDPLHKDIFGYTPIDIAQHFRRDVILDYFNNSTTKEEEEMKPIFWRYVCSQGGCDEVVEFENGMFNHQCAAKTRKSNHKDTKLETLRLYHIATKKSGVKEVNEDGDEVELVKGKIQDTAHNRLVFEKGVCMCESCRGKLICGKMICSLGRRSVTIMMDRKK